MNSRFLAKLWVILALSCGAARAQSPAPPLLPFQGRLTDANGAAIADGARVVQFKIYDAPVGGQAVWNGEVQKLTVNAGMVNTLLGTKADLSPVDFNRTLYLEITIDANADDQITPADPPLLPRQTILPAVFAKEAADSRKLAGWDWGSLLNTNDPVNGTLSGRKLADGSLPASKIADGSLPASKIANASITAVQISQAAVQSDQIALGAVVTDGIAEGSITATKLAADAIGLVAPPGSVSAYMGTNDPPGWLICDGRLVPKSQYGRLYQVIRDVAGAPGDTNLFRLPDLRGFFLRGANRGRADTYRDPDVATRNATPGYPQDGPGSWQADSLGQHDHEVFPKLAGFGTGAGDYISGAVVHNSGYGTSRSGTAGGNETRPKNAYVNYIIKY